MEKLLQKTLKIAGIWVFLLFNTHQLKAQVIFNTLFTGDSKDGFVVENSSEAKILNGATGTGADYIKTKLNPLSVKNDSQNNIAVAYNGQTRILRKDDGQDNIVVIPLLSGGSGTGVLRGIAIDKEDEFLYYSAESSGSGRIYGLIWKNDGTDASVGYYVDKPVGTLTENIEVMQLITSGDLLFMNGSATRTAYTFGQLKGIEFDANGNLYVADATNHRLDKIDIVKKTVSGHVCAGNNSITLADVSGLKTGDLVSGLNISGSTYIGSISGNTIALVDGSNVARDVSCLIVDGTTLVFITGVSNITGNGTAGSSLGSTAGDSQLNISVDANIGTGLAFDMSGNLFIGDAGNSRILKIAAVGGEISAFSPISVFISQAPETDNIRGITIDKNNNLYFTNHSNHTVYRTNSAGNDIQTVAGSGGRITIPSASRFSLTENSNVIQMTTHAHAITFLNSIKVGMYIRGAAAYRITGAKITAIDLEARTITLNMPSAVTNTTPGSSTLFATSADDFITTEDDKGYFDGCAALTLLDRGSSEDLVVADALGFNVRILKGVNMLPVTLSGSFEAKLNSTGTVDLYWQTASEQDNSHFVIKRSTDGIAYSEITIIPSKGVTGASYYATDINPVSGINYYQLSQVDRNGKTEVLGTKSVNVVIAGESGTAVYPNPIKNNQFTIKTVSANNTINVNLADLSGRKVFESLVSGNGNNAYTIQLPQKLVAGIYLLSVDGKYTQKLIVE